MALPHYQPRDVRFQQVIQPGSCSSFLNVTCKSPLSPLKNCKSTLALVLRRKESDGTQFRQSLPFEYRPVLPNLLRLQLPPRPSLVVMFC
jgi:hypothetical protein